MGDVPLHSGLSFLFFPGTGSLGAPKVEYCIHVCIVCRYGFWNFFSLHVFNGIGLECIHGLGSTHERVYQCLGATYPTLPRPRSIHHQ